MIADHGVEETHFIKQQISYGAAQSELFLNGYSSGSNSYFH